MASIKTQFAVGLFVLVGLVVIASSVIWLGLSGYFEVGQTYLAFFDESVQGLDKDSAVKYRGVPIGRVEAITVAPDGSLIQVAMKIQPGVKPGEDMVAQLKSIGITGIMFVELDRKAPNEPNRSPGITFEPEHPVIQTKPSEIKQMLSNVNDVLHQVRLMNLDAIAAETRQTLDGVRRSVENARIGEIASDVRNLLGKADRILDVDRWQEMLSALTGTVHGIDRTVGRLDGVIRTNETQVQEAFVQMNAALEKIDRLLGEPSPETSVSSAVGGVHRAVQQAETLMEDASGTARIAGNTLERLNQSLVLALQQLGTSIENLNRVLDLVSAQPSRLFFGKAPPPRDGLEQD